METLELIVLFIRIIRLPELLAMMTALTLGQKMIVGVVLVLFWAESFGKKGKDAKKSAKKA